MSTLAKPVLRGHCSRFAVKTLLAGGIFAVFNASLYYFFVAKPKKDAYHEFIRTYNPDEHMKELERYGMLSYKKFLEENK